MKKKYILATALALTLGAGAVHDLNSIDRAVAQTVQTVTPSTGVSQTNQTLSLSEADTSYLLAALLRGDFEIEALIEANWTDAYIPPAIEMYNFIPNPDVRRTVLRKLQESTGQNIGPDMSEWYSWLWNQPELKIAGYDNFKSEFYKRIDPKFGKYFKDRAHTSEIRLDEIRWGGVRQDGIPPLRQPNMISAKKANYLDDDNVVFGIEVNGDVRAYPKRILAWHEMFVDRVGGVDVAGVYCTLCGTVILYDTDAKGLSHDIGTSGFLYRSNKLMYDRATQSLWNTLKGEPVLGPLVGKDIKFDHRSVVTTTWGKWRELHPDTKVLSLNTGHRRNYDEGVAYHEYFATDDLMFHTPFSDHRLKNKEEVLALRFKGGGNDPVAISTNFLEKNPIYSGVSGKQKFVVLTDETGANRVYDPAGVTFKSLNGDNTITDSQGARWQVAESRLTHPDGRELKRLPYHRAFWFGWHASYPNTHLIK